MTEHTITLTLSEEEAQLVTALAREQGFDTPQAALRALLHDAMAVYDALWDKTFADSQTVLEQLAEEAHAEYLAGLTEAFDPDNDAP
jgi:acid phosphatase family membrane protein YuiD